MQKGGFMEPKQKKTILKVNILPWLILLIYPLRHVNWGLDLWDTGYNYANFQYMGTEHMDSMWLFSTYLANVTGNFLMNDDTVAIYYDTRVTGSRTGVTEDGCRSIASIAKHDGMELICIVTGAASVLAEDGYKVKEYGGYSETSALLNIGFSGYDLKQIVYKNQIMSQ
jgi:hypothetical protein